MYTLEDRQLDPQSRLYMITPTLDYQKVKCEAVAAWQILYLGMALQWSAGREQHAKKKCLICSKEAMYNKSPASFISFYSPNLFESCLQRALRAA